MSGPGPAGFPIASNHGGPHDIPMHNAGSSGLFTGAVNTDARSSMFNDIGRDLNITYVNAPSQAALQLATLKPAERSSVFVPRCIDGTREYVFEEIDRWLHDVDVPNNILLLLGNPGAGKSAIASSLISRLTDYRRLGSAFFFRRGDVTLSDPAALWRTVAHDLAKSDSFAQALVAVMKETGVDPGRPEIDLHFRYLIAEPLKKTYGSSHPHTIPVVVIDALDECDSDRDQGQALQRKALVDTLVQWSSLPRGFRLIVTARDDRIPDSLRAVCKHIVLPTGNHVTAEANNDIRRFFEKRFAELSGSSYSEWPGVHILDTLTVRAAGLFIWADIVTKFLEQDLPDEQLKLVLSGNLGEADNLTILYQQVIDVALRDIKDLHLEAVKLVIGTVVLAKVPLYCNDLYRLVSQPKTSVDFVIRKLSSVVSMGATDKRLQICHQSFSEFICDPKRCPEKFFIDPGEYNYKMAMMCFKQMKEGLRFNICDLETSYFLKDLPKIVEKPIPGFLSYACRFWIAHVQNSRNSQQYRDILLLEINDLLYLRFLFWLEVMSLVEDALVANLALLAAIQWIGESEKNLYDFARDASRFVVNFDVPISTSVPHIYLSALPFSPSESLVVKQYQPMFPNTVVVVSGRDQHWPAMLSLCRGHTSLVLSTAFSPDGKCLVSGSHDTTIRIWDAETGQTIMRPFEGHTDAVNTVAFSPDGKLVISGSDDKTIRIWNVEKGETAIGPLAGHTDAVKSVMFSPDGKRFVSGSDDKTIRLWDVETGRAIAGPLIGHIGAVDCVAFSQDGQRIVSGSYDGTIRIWDVEDGWVPTAPLTIQTAAVESVMFSPDGKSVVSGSDDKMIRIWDAENGQITAGPFGGHTGPVKCVAYSPDGKSIASGSWDSTVRVRDVESGETTRVFEGHTGTIRSVAFSPNGKHVASGSWDETIRVWGVDQGPSTVFKYEGKPSLVVCVAFSPDGKRVASGSWDKVVQIWDVETGRTTMLEGHSLVVSSVAFSPDGRRVASGSFDETVRIWDLESGENVAVLKGHTSEVDSVAFSPDGKCVVVGSWDKRVQIWDPERGVRKFEGHTADVRSVGFSHDGKLVVSGSSDMTIRIWDVEKGEMAAGPFEGHTDAVRSVAFSPDNRSVVSGSDDMTILIWDVETGKPSTGPLEGHKSFVRSVKFSPDGRRLVSGSWDTTIRVWDLEKPGNSSVVQFEGHRAEVNSVDFSADGKRIVSGSFDKTIRIWDICAFGDDAPSDGPENGQMRRHMKVYSSIGGGKTFSRLQEEHISSEWLYSVHEEEDSKGVPVFWVPQSYHSGLCGIETLDILGMRTNRLDLSRLKHGTAWAQCYDASAELALPPALTHGTNKSGIEQQPSSVIRGVVVLVIVLVLYYVIMLIIN